MMTASNYYKSLSPKLASGVFRYSMLHHFVLYRVGIQIYTEVDRYQSITGGFRWFTNVYKLSSLLVVFGGIAAVL